MALSIKPTIKQAGVTITELLVTMTVIAALALITMPAWSQLTRSQASKTAATLVMSSLEQARIAATSGQKEVWVIFRHSPDNSRDGLRILSRTGERFTPEGAWASLPSGISFQGGTGNLLDERPPENVLSQAVTGGTGGSTYSYGALMFQRSGRIGIPKQDGNRLSITLCSSKPSNTQTIALSRATGRCTLR